MQAHGKTAFSEEYQHGSESGNQGLGTLAWYQYGMQLLG